MVVDHHVDDEIATGQPGDGRTLLVNGISFQLAVVGTGMFEKLRAVPGMDGVGAGNARTDQFRPPEKPAMKCGSIRPVVIFSSARA